jgi:hypothetical protein
MPAGPAALLDRLAAWKSQFGPADTAALTRLLSRLSRTRFRNPADLIRFHEIVLFLRAYPRSASVARFADSILASMSVRVAALRRAGRDLSAFEDPAISGIAGTAFSAVFSYEVVRRLAARDPSLEIDWEAHDQPDRLGPVGCRLIPMMAEDWPVEAHPPYLAWIDAVRRRNQTSLAFLLQHIAALPIDEPARADLYDSLQAPVRMDYAATARNRSQLILGSSRRLLFIHKRPLIQRRDVSLDQALASPPLPIRRVPEREARRVLDLILDTSAARYRELYGFSHPDAAHVYHADPGRGVDIYFFGVPPEWRLPIRSYHGGMFFKNGVPAGYVEVLSVFERAEVGFNLYYTFREGESAWIYAQLLRLFHQTLGVNVFSVDPYQIGHENGEAIDSGAFWFYRKLGFRPADPAIAALTEKEERRLAETPGVRSTPRTLRKLAAGYILYEGPGAQCGAWDHFHIRNVGVAAVRANATNLAALVANLKHWSELDQKMIAAIQKAKSAPEETRYLNLMQKHARFREAVIRLGSKV